MFRFGLEDTQDSCYQVLSQCIINLCTCDNLCSRLTSSRFQAIVMTSEIVITEKEENKKFKGDIDGEEFRLRKRLPVRFPKRKNDVYVSQRTNFRAQLSRCNKLLSTSHNEIFVHGLGLAIDRAINIALQLKATGLGTIEVSATTETVELTDDLVAVDGELEDRTQTRNTSAIHVRVFKVDKIDALKTDAARQS